MQKSKKRWTIIKSIFVVLFVVFVNISTAYNANNSPVKTKEITSVNQVNTQEKLPLVDGFVAQASGSFNTTLNYADLKRFNGFSREVYLVFNLSNLTITANSAKLRIFCQSFDKFGDLSVALYSLPENQTSGLTWATRPTVSKVIASMWINQTDHTNTWLEFDISSSLHSILSSQSATVTYVLKVISGNDALVRFATSESATNKPSIILSSQNPINLGVNSSIKMPSLFSDKMVIQRDKPIRIWGDALPNVPVSITFDGQTYTTQSNAIGKFSINLPSKSASINSFTLSVSSNNETFIYRDIVMGDVYLCGGQSNMAFLVNGALPNQVTNATVNATYPNLRFFEVAKIVSGGVLINANDNPWKSALPGRVVNWAALAYFVGRDMHTHLNIPIGLINVSHGGAPSDAFISPESYVTDPILNAAKRPDGTGILFHYTTPSSLYNSMISKVAGYPIKAVLWYQAEANASFWTNFKTILKGLIKDWRNKWNDPTLPWLFVQLPSFNASGDSTNRTWAETRDIQRKVWNEDPTTGMIVTMDLGEADDIHPQDKLNVAKRMVPYVKALVYGEAITHKSPTYKTHQVQDADLFLSFDNLGSGLTNVKPITEFEIAGANMVYQPATATLLTDNRIKLTNASIANPLYARYAFLNFTTISIFTTDALPLPLAPFKTESGGTLSVKDFAGNSTSLLVYPNPLKGLLNIIKVGNPETITVFDLTGRKVYEHEFSNSVNLSFLTKGFYFVKTDLNQVVKIQIQ